MPIKSAKAIGFGDDFFPFQSREIVSLKFLLKMLNHFDLLNSTDILSVFNKEFKKVLVSYQ